MPKTPITRCPYCGNAEDFAKNCYQFDKDKSDEEPLFEAAIQCLDCDLQTGSSANTKCPCDSREEAIEAAIEIWNNFAEHCDVEPLKASIEKLQERNVVLETTLENQCLRMAMLESKLEQLTSAVRPVVTFGRYYNGGARVSSEHFDGLARAFDSIQCTN